MRSLLPLLAATAITLATPALAADSNSDAAVRTPNPKRGLAFTPNENWPDDDFIWSNASSSTGILSWYYNFGWERSPAYESVPQETLEFVPMMWGAGTSNGTDSYFAGNISQVIDKEGRNITHVMSFSHPDSQGGSEMTPKIAARSWVNNAVPLQERGVKVGLPIVGDPNNWVEPFLANCSQILADKKKDQKECKFDFVPITSYGDMSVLKDRVDMFAKAFPGIPIWLVEYGYTDQDLPTTQKFFNESLKYLEETDVIARYAWFGACRSTVSNVGPNAAMLNPYGELTDIGSWYIGGNATGKEAIPTDQPAEAACTPEKPCGGGKNGATTAAGLQAGLFSAMMAATVFVVSL